MTLTNDIYFYYFLVYETNRPACELEDADDEDLTINVDSDVLKISHSSEDEKVESDFSHKEFSYSSFERSFRLPDSIDIEKIDAKMENGILRIKLPKKEESIDKGPMEIKIA